MGLLRGLTFLAVIEAFSHRLLPYPNVTALPGWLAPVQVSFSQAGSLAFHLAFLLATAALVHVASRVVRDRVWSPGVNGFLATCLFCLATLGLAAAALEPGPLHAVSFTLLSLLTLLVVGMQAYGAPRSMWRGTFAVTYSAAIVCSAAATIVRFMENGPETAPLLDDGAARAAGEILLLVASAAGFIAFVEIGTQGRRGRTRVLASLLLAGGVATGFASLCLIAPPGLSPLAPEAGAVSIWLLSCALFMAGLTALMNLFEPWRRMLGYGLLLLLLAGFPLRLAYHQLIMVLGAILVLAAPTAEPEQAVEAPVSRPSETQRPEEAILAVGTSREEPGRDA